jgi:hypothetical protein
MTLPGGSAKSPRVLQKWLQSSCSPPPSTLKIAGQVEFSVGSKAGIDWSERIITARPPPTAQSCAF